MEKLRIMCFQKRCIELLRVIYYFFIMFRYILWERVRVSTTTTSSLVVPLKLVLAGLLPGQKSHSVDVLVQKVPRILAECRRQG